MGSDSLRERVESLDVVVVAVGLSFVLVGSVMVGSGALGVVGSEATERGVKAGVCSVSPVGVAEAQTSENGSVFVFTETGELSRLDAGSGEKLWNATVPVGNGNVFPRQNLVVDGTIYMSVYNSTDDSGLVAAYSIEGERQWIKNFSASKGPRSAPSYANGSVFVQTYNDTLAKLDAESGSIEWEHFLGNGAGGFPPAEYYNGSMYVGTDDGRVIGVNATTGQRTFSESVYSSTGVNGLVIEGEGISNVSAFLAGGNGEDVVRVSLEGGGKVVWRTASDVSKGGITNDGSFYGVGPGELQRINLTDGAVEWSGGGGDTSPAYYSGNNSIVWVTGSDYAEANATTGNIVYPVATDVAGTQQTIGSGGVVYSIYRNVGDIIAYDLDSRSVVWSKSVGSGSVNGVSTFVSAASSQSDGTLVEQDSSVDIGPLEPCNGLWVDAREYMAHNLTTSYSVYAYDEETESWENVTQQADVSSSDASALSIGNGTLSSTTDKSVNKYVYVKATLDRFSGTARVTVATETVNNTDILPPMQSATAMIGDDNGLVVVLATAISAGIAFFASSLAGVAAFPVIVTGAWVAGYVGTHVLLGGILMSIFIGLNVAQVVEYSG
jgi:outer membrane protein assembly factor BamB